MMTRWRVAMVLLMLFFAVSLAGCQTEHYNEAIGYEDGGRLVVTVETPAAEPDAVRVYQTGIDFEEDTIIVVSFEALAAAPRKMRVQTGFLEDAVTDMDEATVITGDVFDLTPTLTTFHFHFTAVETDTGVIIFDFGMIDGDAVATDVTIDNVEVRPFLGETQDLADVVDVETLERGKNLVVNGNFGQGTDGWTLNVADAAAATMSVVDGEMMGIGWMQWIVARVADLIYQISKFTGGFYVVGLLLVTLIIRIVGWPIYSKTTALSTNMNLAQPELDKLKEKYMGKRDPQSQRMMQQETMRIYKEYGINPLGCLLPFLQMPIFIAMYQTVRRLPLTQRYQDLNFRFTPWVDFTDVPAEPFLQNIGSNITFIIMALIVGLTMFGYQMYAQKKPEILHNKKFQSEQQQKTERTMKYMMYFMTAMLVFIAYTNLGIAFYWIIGNLFQFLQTYVNRKRTIARVLARKQAGSALKTGKSKV